MIVLKQVNNNNEENNMKMKQSAAVALMVAVGFPKAGDWELSKLQSRINQVPSKVARDTVPEGFLGTYDDIEKDAGSVIVVAAEGAAAEDNGADDQPKKKKSKTASEKSEPLDRSPGSGQEQPSKKKKSKRSEKITKATKVAKSATDKAVSQVKRDSFGCKEGTISAKVNAVLSEEWQDESEISKAAGVTLDEARGRLYYGAEKKIIEYRRRIEYRLIPVAGEAAPKKKKK